MTPGHNELVDHVVDQIRADFGDMHIGFDLGAPGGDKTAVALIERTADGLRLLHQQAEVKVGDVLDALEAVFRAQMQPRPNYFIVPHWWKGALSYRPVLGCLSPPTEYRPQRGARGRKCCVMRLMGARLRRSS